MQLSGFSRFATNYKIGSIINNKVRRPLTVGESTSKCDEVWVRDWYNNGNGNDYLQNYSTILSFFPGGRDLCGTLVHLLEDTRQGSEKR